MDEEFEIKNGTLADADKRGYRATGLLGRRALLVVVSGPQLGRSCIVASSPVVVGRQAGCDLVLEDPLLSRRHFRVSPAGEGDFILEDLDSKNSTYLNTKRLAASVLLHYGDRIVAGRTVLRFFLEEEPERKAGRSREALA
jgi:pSer/pThr/pTyr-binding forkhead associated (FHA) protein